jgi:hypothetical protein
VPVQCRGLRREDVPQKRYQLFAKLLRVLSERAFAAQVTGHGINHERKMGAFDPFKPERRPAFTQGARRDLRHLEKGIDLNPDTVELSDLFKVPGEITKCLKPRSRHDRTLSPL